MTTHRAFPRATSLPVANPKGLSWQTKYVIQPGSPTRQALSPERQTFRVLSSAPAAFELDSNRSRPAVTLRFWASEPQANIAHFGDMNRRSKQPSEPQPPLPTFGRARLNRASPTSATRVAEAATRPKVQGIFAKHARQGRRATPSLPPPNPRWKILLATDSLARRFGGSRSSRRPVGVLHRPLRFYKII